MVTLTLASILLLAITLHPTSSEYMCIDVGGPFCSWDFGVRGTVEELQFNKHDKGQVEKVTYSVLVHELYRNISDGIDVNGTLSINSPAGPDGPSFLKEGEMYLFAGKILCGIDMIRWSFGVPYNEYVNYKSNPDGVKDDDYKMIDLPCLASMMMPPTTFVVIIFALINLL